MAANQNPTPKNDGLAQDIINEGKKVAQAGAVDQGAVKAQAVAASQGTPAPAQPANQPSAPTAQAPAPVEGKLSVNADEFAEFQRWKDFAKTADAQTAKEFMEFKASKESAKPQTAAPVQQAQASNPEKEYGKNYVHASRNGVEQYFTAVTWRNLGGDQNKVGYKRVLSTPPEVAALKK